MNEFILRAQKPNVGLIYGPYSQDFETQRNYNKNSEDNGAIE